MEVIGYSSGPTVEDQFLSSPSFLLSLPPPPSLLFTSLNSLSLPPLRFLIQKFGSSKNTSEIITKSPPLSLFSFFPLFSSPFFLDSSFSFPSSHSCCGSHGEKAQLDMIASLCENDPFWSFPLFTPFFFFSPFNSKEEVKETVLCSLVFHVFFFFFLSPVFLLFSVCPSFLLNNYMGSNLHPVFHDSPPPFLRFFRSFSLP